ncbi:McbB family protein [Sporolactobacillus sp. CPB3-1]|uniref:McbB family protein n=1 Tax=Sporolactobacillus mangiferae TaxID=2940498 RepID=A0ABT0M9P0_9BACL|nr:McbB family protein [Sporolactobacillus mangiferae]MCL1631596.1 McbB family protein [Sporolactobacillus mangiferae]
MEYEIQPFFLYKGKKKTVLQNINGAVDLNDRTLINLLTSWDSEQKKVISYDELRMVFTESIQELLDFLDDNGIIKEKIKKEYSIKRIIILADDAEIRLNIKQMLLELNAKEIRLYIVEKKEIIDLVLSSNDLLIVSLTKFKPRFADYIKERVIKSNSVLLMGYCYANNYYIDNLYKHDWYLPCHTCNFENLKNQLRINNGSSINYQQLLDIIYKSDEDTTISYPISHLNKNLISIELYKKVASFIGDGQFTFLSPDEYNDIEMIQLKDSNIIKDSSFHWELCDCYEK